MPVLEQFKNFIRHGKAAREAPEGLTNDPAAAGPSIQVQPATDTQQAGFAPSDKALPVPAATSHSHAAPSTAAVAASTTSTTAAPSTSTSNQHQSDQARDMRQSSNGNHLAVPAAGSSKGDQYQREAERIVAEEREASEKMPYYEGLSERFQLIKKMGDGAFSNVYKARDRQTGQKVAIKVVRKYELNSNQNASGQGASDRQQDACHPLSALGRLPSSVHFFRLQQRGRGRHAAGARLMTLAPMLNPYTRRPEQESGTSASMPCKRQTARTELTTFYPPSLTLLVVLSPPSATLYLQNTLAHTAGSQDRLDPNFRKKNRVTEPSFPMFAIRPREPQNESPASSPLANNPSPYHFPHLHLARDPLVFIRPGLPAQHGILVALRPHSWPESGVVVPLISTPHVRANILKEVQIMRNLKHDGIVDLLSFSESRDHYFLVLELMEGGELFHQIVKLTYFSEALARHVILQVAHAIRYLHEERGVVHRDIKPENLLFESIKIIPSKHPIQRPYDEEKEDEGEFMPGIGGGGIGRVKIADFGLSKVVWEESTMTPCGTVGYTAPEIVKDERYSKSVDMWALGCVLYTLLCGFPPFYDESISVLTEKVAKGYYTFLSPWWDDISASAKDLITHLLCVDPRQRYTIDEFLRHPWCNVKDPIPDLNSADIALAKASEMPLDSPLLASMKSGNAARNAMMSPGINRLKEAFDVTYAVHRMEEEGARKRAGGGNPLGELNEEDESDEADEARRKYGEEAGRAVESQRGARVHNEASAAKAQPRQAAPQQQQQPQQQPQRQAQQYQGRGGADRRLAEAALYDGRAGPRDRGQNSNRKRGFELNMGNATLLGRRNKAAAGAPRLDNLGKPIIDGAHAAGVVPGSPMRVD
ncbi:hypothetical protein PaG_06535 [Moesziomyces aphidis]|uniref:Protein kinase domain-containing protein n=1 Tax=Moesziomyces aphidis TaxID=84754 RepID=W3VFU6_MOEAP|nr:hypothetical protein PaG_06535 [Moesziomyces aphidis]